MNSKLFGSFFEALAESISEELVDSFILWVDQDPNTPDVIKEVILKVEGKLTNRELAVTIAAASSMAREQMLNKAREVKAQRDGEVRA